MTSSTPVTHAAGNTAENNSGPERHRVFIVEDHPVVRDGLAQLINDEPDLRVCGLGGDIENSLREIAAAAPAVVVVDLLLGAADGLDLVRALRTSFPQVRTLVLSMYAESLYAERALRAGARGYVAKLAPTDTVIVAIRRVLAGDIYVSEAVTTRLFSKLVGGGEPAGRNASQGSAGARNSADADNELSRLSDREFQVFGLIGKGLGPTDIAAQLGVSVKTIETYKDNLKKKLGLDSGRDLLRRAVQYALEQEQISSPPPSPPRPGDGRA